MHLRYAVWTHVTHPVLSMLETTDVGLAMLSDCILLFVFVFFFLFLFFVTPEGFTTVVANEGLEKARAYLNQVPRDRRLYIPSKGCGVNFRWKHLQTTPTHFLGRAE